MTREEKLKLLEEFQKRYETLQSEWQALGALVGASRNSSLGIALCGMVNSYMAVVASSVGESYSPGAWNTWMSWFCYDNDFGRARMEKSPGHGVPRKMICTFDDLCDLIEYKPQEVEGEKK
jgi:hypothetical protein